MTQRLPAIVLLLATMLVPTASGAAERVLGTGTCHAGAETAGRVADIVDGDTLRLEDGRVVRLAGIEAPKPPLGDGGAFPLAEAARRTLAHLAAGRVVALTPIGPDHDRYGRLHARAALADGTSLQARLVAAGLARIHGLAAERACLAALYAVERKARAAHLGIWGDRGYLVRAADDPSLIGQNGLYELVEGRVVSVGRGSWVVFLDFGRIWRRDFTVMMSRAMAERLADAGTPVEALEKRRIRVRGVIEESGGPAIRVDDPSAIELLDD